MSGAGTAALIIGILGAICIGAFSLPGLIRIIKTRDTYPVSIIMYSILFSGSMLFVISTTITMCTEIEPMKQFGVLLGNVLSASFSLATLIIKLKNQRKAKKLGITEKEYCAKLLAEKKAKKNPKEPTLTIKNDVKQSNEVATTIKNDVKQSNEVITETSTTKNI